MTSTQLTFETAPSLVVRVIAVSDWMTVSQDRVDHFAAASDDCGWLHTDPIRAKQDSPFGGTIAHGFLTLALMSTMARSVDLWPANSRYEVNYGVSNVRFTAPVRVGERIRAQFSLKDVLERPDGGHLFTTGVSVEIEKTERPAMFAEWLTLFYPAVTNRTNGTA